MIVASVSEPHTSESNWYFSYNYSSIYLFHIIIIPNLEELFKPLEDAIRQQFLPSLTGQNPFSDADRNLMALPVRFGGLGIINPSQQCTANNSMAEKTTAPLVALILQQSHSYPPEVKAEQLKARKDSRTIHRQQEKEAACISAEGQAEARGTESWRASTTAAILESSALWTWFPQNITGQD